MTLMLSRATLQPNVMENLIAQSPIHLNISMLMLQIALSTANAILIKLCSLYKLDAPSSKKNRTTDKLKVFISVVSLSSYLSSLFALLIISAVFSRTVSLNGMLRPLLLEITPAN
jgi:hypothetical protein